MRQEDRVELPAAGFIIYDHAVSGFGPSVAEKIHTIDPAMKSECMAIAKGNFPRRIAFLAERKLDRYRIEFVLLAHPGDECLNEVLKRAAQKLAAKSARLGGLQETVAVAGDIRLGDSANSSPRFLRRNVTPPQFVTAQLIVKLCQDIVLKGSLLFNIEFEKFSLFRAKARMNEKFEGAGRELLHPAHRRS